MTANYRHPDFFSPRPGESAEAHRRRITPFLHHREDAQAEADQAHAQYRQLQEQRTTGEGVGLGGLETSPQARASAIGSRGFGSGREVERNGHLSWEANHNQPGLRRILASDIRADHDQPGESPLAQYFRTRQ